MAGYDKYGNYVNNAGVTIKVSTDKRGNVHMGFYDGPVDEDHSGLHVNLNTNDGSWNSSYHGKEHSDKSYGSGKF